MSTGMGYFSSKFINDGYPHIAKRREKLTEIHTDLNRKQENKYNKREDSIVQYIIISIIVLYTL
jgi:hypothetical protein